MAVEKDVGENESAGQRPQGVAVLPFGEWLDRLEALQDELFGETTFTGDSVEFIREARDERASSQTG